VLAERTTALLLVAGAALSGCGVAYQAKRLPLTATPARNDKAFDEAMGLAMQLKYQEASDRFEAVFPRLHAAGDTAGAAEAMFWVGYCYEKQGRKTQAAEWYKRVVRAYLWEPAASEAAKRYARLSEAPGNIEP